MSYVPISVILCSIDRRFWFAGHLHVHFAARVTHSTTGNVTRYGGRIHFWVLSFRLLRFLATDKPILGRRFLQFIDIFEKSGEEPCVSPESSDAPQIYFDEEWLAILMENNSNIPISYLPAEATVK